MGKQLLTIVNGEKVKYDIILEYESNDKNYVVYLDNKVNEEGTSEVYLATYTINDDIYDLTPVTSKEELETFETIIKEVQKETKSND